MVTIFPLIKILVDQPGVDVLDPGLGMHAVGMDGHLIAQQGNGVTPRFFHRHGKQRHGHLLAGR